MVEITSCLRNMGLHWMNTARAKAHYDKTKKTMNDMVKLNTAAVCMQRMVFWKLISISTSFFPPRTMSVCVISSFSNTCYYNHSAIMQAGCFVPEIALHKNPKILFPFVEEVLSTFHIVDYAVCKHVAQLNSVHDISSQLCKHLQNINPFCSVCLFILPIFQVSW